VASDKLDYETLRAALEKWAERSMNPDTCGPIFVHERYRDLVIPKPEDK
jgi:hypothetical protein